MGVSFANQEPVWDNLRQDREHDPDGVAGDTDRHRRRHDHRGALRVAARHDLDKVSTNVAIAFYSFPTQWLALVLSSTSRTILPSHGMSNAS